MLIDKYLPTFDVRDYRELCVKSEPEQAYAALRSVNLNRSLTVRALLAIRTLPERLGGQHRHSSDSASSKSFLQSIVQVGWVVLEEIPAQELVAGAITQPWAAVVRFQGVSGEALVAFSEPGFAKIAWNIAA